MICAILARAIPSTMTLLEPPGKRNDWRMLDTVPNSEKSPNEGSSMVGSVMGTTTTGE